MRMRDLRLHSGRGGYLRPGSVGRLTTVWVERSDSADAVLVSTVVTMKSSEGKR
jgi:hypothetical protein